MNRTTRLAAALAFGAGLTAAGLALAQTQPESAAPPSAAPPPPAEPWAQSDTPAVQPGRLDLPQPAYSVERTSQPTYSVDPPPEGASGIYLPAVVLGYAKSAAGCVVVGCEDGPQAGGAPDASPSGPSPSGSAEPPPAGPGPSDPH